MREKKGWWIQEESICEKQQKWVMEVQLKSKEKEKKGTEMWRVRNR